MTTSTPFVLAAVALFAAEPEVAALRLLEPFWSSPVVHRESSVLLAKSAGGPAVARLAFPAEEILEVATPDRSRVFRSPQDYALDADGSTLRFARPPLATIAETEFFPPANSPDSYGHRTGNAAQNLLYRPGRWFHDRDVEITYRRRAVGAVPPTLRPAPGALPKTLARLRAGLPLTLGVSGDSIATGADASALGNAPPRQPGFAELVAAVLRTRTRGEVRLRNRAVGGWSVANGVVDLDNLLAEKPDLIVLAYGMNDVGRRDPKWFGDQNRLIVARVRNAAPQTELVLVAPMLGHKEWVHTPREMFPRYRDELRKLCGPGVALADATAAWELLLTAKHDLDLTGNGLNHPNDFGHRVYAQTLLAAILAE